MVMIGLWGIVWIDENADFYDGWDIHDDVKYEVTNKRFISTKRFKQCQ